MLVFACGGLDSAIRHLARDCAEPMLERSENLRRAAEEFARRKLGMDVERSRFLVGLVRGGDPELDKKLVEALIQEETERSLQSHETALNITTHFEVKDDELTVKANNLHEIFATRNLIIHEMDVNFDAVGRKRNVRRRDNMVASTEAVLNVTSELITRVRAKLDG